MQPILTKDFYNVTTATDDINRWVKETNGTIEVVGEYARPYRMKTKNGKYKTTTKQVTTVYYKEIQ